MQRHQTQEEFDALPWLHVYAQPFWHGEAEIIGTRAALTGLRDAVDAALKGREGRAEGIVKDGEGYDVIVRIRSRQALERERLPYTEDYARSDGPATKR